MRKQGIDGTGMLNLYDRVTGIFNEIFDARLLTAAIFALVGYCTLFMQRKFPMRWMIFVLFGMILLAFVTLTARMPGKAKVRFHKGMAGLWFALHGMMVVSGLFYQDWLTAVDLLPHRLFRVRLERGRLDIPLHIARRDVCCPAVSGVVVSDRAADACLSGLQGRVL